MSVRTLQDTAQLLESLSKQKCRPYASVDFGREPNPKCMSVIVSAAKSELLVRQIRPQLGPGWVAFVGTTKWYGDERHRGVEVVIGPGNDQFDILRLAQTDAVNYGMDTEDLIRKLREFDRRVGIDILYAETDTIEFYLKSMPANLPAFCEEVYEFCADIVDQGFGSLERLSREILETKKVLLWWD